MMDAGVVIIKERTSMVKVEYSVLKEEIKEDECGWYYCSIWLLGRLACVAMISPMSHDCTMEYRDECFRIMVIIKLLYF
jgi:hypothetical protein